ncbi:hypothetical protein BJ508DRAFT_380478 [Ascobolus immersus RN42]|uniref:Uncharacterized protein n=1 Tax=Ascobolus immersus RN42 TaxID=1160509 RepID=A0A3N4HS82_ASCIM|nr:hypothetical protein BJ508DRAFT_380478 [Ascobolus immersus RN42]
MGKARRQRKRSSQTAEEREEATMNAIGETQRSLENEFEADNMYVQALTTLLGLFGVHSKFSLHPVPTESARHAEQITLLSALLAADDEDLVAILPKRNIDGIALFCALQNPKKRTVNDGHPQRVFLSTTETKGFDSVIEHVYSKWGTIPTFEEHCHITGTLLAQATKSVHEDSTAHGRRQDEAFVDLCNYSVFRSIQKITRRLESRCFTVNFMTTMQEAKCNISLTSAEDTMSDLVADDRISLEAVFDVMGIHAGTFPACDEYIRNKAVTDSLQFVSDWLAFFQRCLVVIDDKAKALQSLFYAYQKATTQRPSIEIFEQQIEETTFILNYLMHCAWHSVFARRMITQGITYQPHGSANIAPICDSGNREFRSTRHPAKFQSEESKEGKGGSTGARMLPSTWPEFGLCTDAHSRMPSSAEMEIIYWLRLVTAPIRHIQLLRRGSKAYGSKIIPALSIHVIQHPQPSPHSLPWESAIRRAYGSSSETELAIEQIQETYGDTNKGSRIVNYPGYQFSGTFHPEAILSTLHYNARHEDCEERFRFEPTVLEGIWQSYPIVAASTPSCPMCTIIQNELSKAAGHRPIISGDSQFNGSGLQHKSSTIYPVFWKHSETFPCSLPIGLPQKVRKRVIRQLELLLIPCIDRFIKQRKLFVLSNDDRASEKTVAGTPIIDIGEFMGMRAVRNASRSSK